MKTSIIQWEKNENSAGGQAIVELTVALIVIIVLLSGLVQVGKLGIKRADTMTRARAEAARLSMSEYYAPSGRGYLYTWLPGDDNKRYTQDDVPIYAAGTVDSIQAVYDMARPEELADYLPANTLSHQGLLDNSADEFFLVHGSHSDSCQTLPAVRHFIYNRASIPLKSEAWLVWTEGIY